TADDRILVEQRLLDPENEVLLTQARVVADVQLFRQCMQLGDRLLLQLSDIHETRLRGDRTGHARPATRGERTTSDVRGPSRSGAPLPHTAGSKGTRSVKHGSTT